MSGSVNVSAGDVLQLLNVAGQVYVQASSSYAQARALAEKAGISKEDLDAADARFSHHYADPLASPAIAAVPDAIPEGT